MKGDLKLIRTTQILRGFATKSITNMMRDYDWFQFDTSVPGLDQPRGGGDHQKSPATKVTTVHQAHFHPATFNEKNLATKGTTVHQATFILPLNIVERKYNLKEQSNEIFDFQFYFIIRTYQNH